MASLEFRSHAYRIIFRFGGKKFQTPLKTADRKEAEGCLGRVEENLRLLERGRLGHQTEEMRKRYRHLIPNQEQAAILTVFNVNEPG